MSSTKRTAFSGTPNSGLFAGSKNCVFFSPALIEQKTGNEIEIEYLKVTIKNNEIYSAPITEDTRQFKFGFSGSSRTNLSTWRTFFKTPEVIATLTQTIPPGPTTVIKIR